MSKNSKTIIIAIAALAVVAFGVGYFKSAKINTTPPIAVEKPPVALCITKEQWKGVIMRQTGVQAKFIELTPEQTVRAMNIYANIPPVSPWPREAFNTIVISGPSVALQGRSLIGGFDAKGCGTQWFPVRPDHLKKMLGEAV